VQPSSWVSPTSVCDHGNIKLAAEQEHIEPSAISKRVAQLETELGAKLLERGRRGVEPTQTGIALLEHARSMLFSAERVRSKVAAFNRGIKGHVRLVATSSALAESLLDDVAEFMRDEDNQNIHIDIEERYSKVLMRSVTDGRASLRVCWDSVDFGKLKHRPYRADELAVAPSARGAQSRQLRADAAIPARRPATDNRSSFDAEPRGGAGRTGHHLSRDRDQLRRRASRRRGRARCQRHANAGGAALGERPRDFRRIAD
jgi:DNA-binding transcriptional LysR family regulator